MTPDNRRYVFGPPGTGKTSHLRQVIRQCADRAEWGPESIIATSMTKTAARAIAMPREGEDDLYIPDDHIGTMHAMCFKQLGLTKKQMTASHLKEFDEAYAQYAISEKRTQDLDEPETDAHFETQGDELMNRYNLLRGQMIPREAWPETVTRFAARWEAWKTEACLYDFTDLIEQCLEDRYRHIPFEAKVLIGDEQQDLTPLQHALFAKWAQDAEYVLAAGDDDQLIFGHTGANAEAFLDPSIPDEHKRVLKQSRRVPLLVQNVANAWIDGVSQRQAKQYDPRRDDSGQIVDGLVRVINKAKYTQPEDAISDAMRQIRSGRSVMFLVACSYMLTPLIRELRLAGVPFHNPYRRSRGDWNPLTTNGYSMGDRLLAVLRPEGHNHGIAERMWTWRDLDAIVDVLPADGVCQRGAKAEIDGRAHDKVESFHEVEMEEIMQLMEPDAWGHLISGDIAWFVDHVVPKKRDTLRYPLAVLKSFGAVALDAAPKVVIGTIHSVKGAEADCVYLFPDISKNAAKAASNGIAGQDAVIRTFYVGVTRAREELIVCCPATTYYAHLPLKAGMQKLSKVA